MGTKGEASAHDTAPDDDGARHGQGSSGSSHSTEMTAEVAGQGDNRNDASSANGVAGEGIGDSGGDRGGGGEAGSSGDGDREAQEGGIGSGSGNHERDWSIRSARSDLTMNEVEDDDTHPTAVGLIP